MDQSRGSPGLLNATRKWSGQDIKRQPVQRNKKNVMPWRRNKKSTTFSLLHSLLWVIHLSIKCLPSRRSSKKQQQEYTQKAWSKYFFRLKSVSENILHCEAQQLGNYLSNEHTKEWEQQKRAIRANMVETRILYILTTKHNKDTKYWYTIDALGAIFAIFIKVLQHL